MITKYKKILSDAPVDKVFRTRQGEIKSLEDLKSQIEEKGESFYGEYTSSGENHFANWVEHVFEDKDLAEGLRKAQSMDSALYTISSRIDYLRLWLEFNEKKEMVYNSAIDPMHAGIEYLPGHDFQTLDDYDPSEFAGLVAKVADRPKSKPRKKASLPKPVLRENSVLTNSTKENTLQAAVSASSSRSQKAGQEIKTNHDEMMLEALEKQYPELKDAQETPRPKGIFSKIQLPFFRK